MLVRHAWHRRRFLVGPSWGAAFALVFTLARSLLSSGASLIVEANFFPDQVNLFASLPEHRSVQIHCQAPLAVLLERYAARARHVGHHDREKIEGLPGRYESGAHGPLDLDGELIQLDTGQPVDIDAVVARVRARL